MCEKYWNNFVKIVQNQNAGNNIYSYLVDMKIGLDFIGSIMPITELKEEMKNVNQLIKLLQ